MRRTTATIQRHQELLVRNWFVCGLRKCRSDDSEATILTLHQARAEVLSSNLLADNLTSKLSTGHGSELRRLCSSKDMMMTMPQLDAIKIALPCLDWTDEILFSK